MKNATGALILYMAIVTTFLMYKNDQPLLFGIGIGVIATHFILILLEAI